MLVTHDSAVDGVRIPEEVRGGVSGGWAACASPHSTW
jgi:hypothetical protein